MRRGEGVLIDRSRRAFIFVVAHAPVGRRTDHTSPRPHQRDFCSEFALCFCDPTARRALGALV
jgi:hypothetical protein